MAGLNGFAACMTIVTRSVCACKGYEQNYSTLGILIQDLSHDSTLAQNYKAMLLQPT